MEYQQEVKASEEGKVLSGSSQKDNHDELLHEIHRGYFEEALIKLQSITQKIIAKPPVYLLNYDQEPKAVKTVLKRWVKDLKLLWGEENLICLMFDLEPGDSTLRYVSQMQKCKIIIVLCTPALKQAYEAFASDHLADQELGMVFAQLVQQKSHVIPFYLDNKDNILFFLKDLNAASLNREKDYQKSIFTILKKLVEDTKLKEAINAEQKRMQQAYKNSKALSLEKQQSLLEFLRQKQTAKQQKDNEDTYHNLKTRLQERNFEGNSENLNPCSPSLNIDPKLGIEYFQSGLIVGDEISVTEGIDIKEKVNASLYADSSAIIPDIPENTAKFLSQFGAFKNTVPLISGKKVTVPKIEIGEQITATIVIDKKKPQKQKNEEEKSKNNMKLS